MPAIAADTPAECSAADATIGANATAANVDPIAVEDTDFDGSRLQEGQDLGEGPDEVCKGVEMWGWGCMPS